MQAIRTNAPSTHGTTNGFNAGSGFYEYLDNAGTSGTDPFHPSLPNGAATNTLFYDGPARSVAPPPKSVSWQAQTFVSTWNSAARTITIYEDGIWWGFDLVSAIPEPSAMALIGLAMTAMRLRRKAMC